MLVGLLVLVLVGLVVVVRSLVRHCAAVWRRAERMWQRIYASTPARWFAQRFPGAWSFVGRRLSPQGYLGLHLTIGFGLSLGALLVFGALANAVGGQDDLARFDVMLAQDLHRAATPMGVGVFRTVTLLGSFPVMLLLGVVVGVVLLERGQRRVLLGWVVGLVGGSLLNLALKGLFERPRPSFADPFAIANGWSFPSGHAMGSLIGYGLLAYVLLRSVRRYGARLAVIVSTAVLIMAIGFSRLYLCVHYFSDVIGGYAAGTVWLGACVSGLETVRRRRQRS